ncbi:MAG: AAA family ATPase [Gammaproteobacteria bacterium]|nr:AAA family ATPase [Gammaproteobacteria bacterium]
MLRDASDKRYDGGTVDLGVERCFDDKSLRWYRKLFDDRNPGYDETLSHVEFLHHWGLVVEAGDRLVPTRAAILLFGTAPAFRQLLPRPVVDWQWNRRHWSEKWTDERWADRLVIETNLVETWKALADRHLQRAEKPFSIDPETLRRDDLPPDYLAFREAAINLLVHQDYADHTRKPVIQVFDDRTLLWNPGDAFASVDDLLEPGEKEVRNPRIVAAFRRIGLSEQAGTGIRAIFGVWQQLGLVPPVIDNDRKRKAFQLILVKEEILPEEQLRFQAELGVHLDDAEAKALAFTCRHGRLRTHDVRAVTGLSGADALAVLDRLAIRTLILPLEGTETPVFVLAEHLMERLGRTGRADDPVGVGASGLVTDQAVREPGSLVTDQAGLESEKLVTGQIRSGQESLSTAQPIGSSGDSSTAQAGLDPADLSTAQARPSGSLVTDQAPVSAELGDVGWKIVTFCKVPRSMTEIMGELGLTHRTFFRRNHLEPLLASGVLRMTHPNQPKHPDQAYVLTEAGARLKAGGGSKQVAKADGNRTNGA